MKNATNEQKKQRYNAQKWNNYVHSARLEGQLVKATHAPSNPAAEVAALVAKYKQS